MKKTQLVLICLALSVCQSLFAAPPLSDSITEPDVKWKFESGASIRGTPLLDEDRIYFGNSEGTVYCLNAGNAALIWKFESGATITSQPTLAGNNLLVSSRGNKLYSIDKGNGTVVWSFALDKPKPHIYGWDYYDASPLVAGESVFISSGNNKIHSLNLTDGKILWEFEAGDKIRATPLAHNGVLYVPSFDGVVYKLSTSNGHLIGKFETEGAAFYGNKPKSDRHSLTARPALENGTLVIGSRDGGLYGIDAKTMEKKWRLSYGSSWTGSNPVIDGDRVYIGWSDKHYVTANDLVTGEEIWKYDTGERMFSDPVMDAENLYMGSFDGKIYSFTKDAGKLSWTYQTGAVVLSSPVLGDNVLYVGNDAGTLLALESGEKSIKAVYQADAKAVKRLIISDMIAPYLEEAGYERLNEETLSTFLANRIQDQIPSVVVFAHSYIPSDLLDPISGQDLLKSFMKSGGKIIWLDAIPPNWRVFDENLKVKGRDTTYAESLWGVEFDINGDFALYYSKATNEGEKIGLPPSFQAAGTFFPDTEGIIPLAYTELGRIASFYKLYSDRPYSGFVYFRSWGQKKKLGLIDLELIRTLAEFEL